MRQTARYLICLITLTASACTPTADPLPASPETQVSTPQASGPIRIGFAALPFARAAYEPSINAFNAANPDLQVEFVALEPTMSDNPSDQARGVAAAADVFSSLLAGPDSAIAGIALDLRPLIDADATFERADYQPGALPTAGPILVLPTQLSVQTLGYNADLFATAGLPEPTPTWTWDDLLASAEQLTVRNGSETITNGLDDGDNGLVVLAGLLAEAGVPLNLDVNGTANLESPKVAAAMKRVSDLLKRGVLYQPNQAAGGAQLSASEFGKHIRDGHVGLWLGGLLIEGVAGDSGTTAFKLGDAMLPVLPQDVILSRRGYMLSAGSANPDAAWRWLSYLSRQEISFGAGIRLFGIGTDVPARRSLAERSSFWDGLPANRTAAIQATLARVERLPYSGDHTIREHLSMALRAIQSGQPAEIALAEAQANLNTQLAERVKTPTAVVPPIRVKLPDRPVIPDGATAISFGAFDANPGVLRQLAEQYNAQHPQSYVTVETPSFDGTDFSLTAFANQHPCFVWPQLPKADQRTALRDLQPLLDSDPTFNQQDYPPALLAGLRGAGALYGLPYAVQLRTLHYNRDLFRTADLSAPTKSWTYDDLLEAARRITNKSGTEPVYGYAVEGPHTADLLAFLSWQNAVAIAGGSPRYTSTAVTDAIGRYLELLRAYSPHTQLQGYTNDGMFINGAIGQEGRIGMWYSRGQSGVIVTIDSGGTGRTPPDLAVAPPPIGTGGLTSADFSSSMLAITSGATDAEAEACWGWLRFLSEQPAGFVDRFPARSSVAKSQAFLSQAPSGADELYAAYADALASSASASDPYIGVDLFWLMRAIDRGLQGGNLQRELAEAQQYTEQYLACVGNGTPPEQCASAVDPTYKGIGPWQ